MSDIAAAAARAGFLDTEPSSSGKKNGPIGASNALTGARDVGAAAMAKLSADFSCAFSSVLLMHDLWLNCAARRYEGVTHNGL
jgi:hypothetical protein